MTNLLNRFAPNFALPLTDGGRFNLMDWRSQVVVLHFWSAGCPWSRRADVALVYRQLSWEPKGVRIAGIASNADESDSQIRPEALARHIKYPILLDLDQSVANAYQAIMTPQFFVIDRQGFIRYCGALDDATQKQRRPTIIYLDQAVTAVLENRRPEPSVTTPYGSPIVSSSSRRSDFAPLAPLSS